MTMNDKILAFVALIIFVGNGSALSSATFDNRTKEVVKTLFKNYDGEIRPLGHENGPTVVSVNLYLRSLEEVKEQFGLEWKPQLTFRMQWFDGRLAFRNKVINTSLEEKSFITVPSSFGKRMWKPDLFFSNANNVKVHTELTQNEYWRIFPDGEVLYSVRLTVSMTCPLSLKKFPHDRQTCLMKLASYGYTTEDIVFIWKSPDPIQVTSSIQIPNFNFKEFAYDYCDADTSSGVYSCLRGDFVIERETGIYYQKIYIPLLICVLIGWLTFFLHPGKAAVSRTILLVASLYYAISARDKVKDEIPSTSYSTAFDRWSSGCLVFILSALCEFILASHFASQIDYVSGPLIRNQDSELFEISLTKDTSQKQEINGNANLLRKLHLQKINESNEMAEGCTRKLDRISRFLYLICFVLFVGMYCVDISEGD